MRRWFIRGALVGAVAVGSSCGDGESLTGPLTTGGIAGTYALQSINGDPLPFVLPSEGGGVVELLSDVLVVTNTETFTRTVQFRTTENGQVATEDVSDTGSYTRDGSSITFVQDDGASITGTVSGNTITLSEEGFVFVYRR